VNAALAGLSRYLGNLFPTLTALWEAANVLVSLGVATLLFAMIYKVLPTCGWLAGRVGRRAGTAGFFSVGKQLIGLYLGTKQRGLELRRGGIGGGAAHLGLLLRADRAARGAEFTGTTSSGSARAAADEARGARSEAGGVGGRRDGGVRWMAGGRDGQAVERSGVGGGELSSRAKRGPCPRDGPRDRPGCWSRSLASLGMTDATFPLRPIARSPDARSPDRPIARSPRSPPA